MPKKETLIAKRHEMKQIVEKGLEKKTPIKKKSKPFRKTDTKRCVSRQFLKINLCSTVFNVSMESLCMVCVLSQINN